MAVSLSKDIKSEVKDEVKKESEAKKTVGIWEREWN